jgi:hypothetical protein
MPSPFPGMNPYLDRPADWTTVHAQFMAVLAFAINKQLPEHYRTFIDQTVYLHELSAQERTLFGRPDVFLSGPRAGAVGGGTATVVAPRIAGIPEGIDVETLRYLKILETRDRQQVIAAIEVLSPTNKTEPDAEVYRQKVHKYLRSDTHFIEIDLLRYGVRTRWNGLTPSDYSVVVSRVEDRPRVDYWPIGLRDRLPLIPIPLRGTDPDVVVDLQEVVNDVYDGGSFGRHIYKQPPDPPLSPEDAAWAAEIVAAATAKS